MNFDVNMTDDTLLALIGKRLADLRLARNLTQRELAEEAGVGLRTVQRLEQGEAATQLSGFIRVCRILGLVDGLNTLLPEQAASPMMLLKMQGRKRQRATGRKPETETKWTWGEP